jgi:hypothetical protein
MTARISSVISQRWSLTPAAYSVCRVSPEFVMSFSMRKRRAGGGRAVRWWSDRGGLVRPAGAPAVSLQERKVELRAKASTLRITRDRQTLQPARNRVSLKPLRADLMSLSLLFLVSAFAAAPLAHYISRGRHGVLLAPALLASIWVVAIGVAVKSGGTLSVVWLPFWGATLSAAAYGLAAIWRQRPRLISLVIPLAATCVVLAPYLWHGIADFPGSWFWDGFTYMALGESLWGHPRGVPIPGAELFFEFGASSANGRFMSGALISLFKNIFPYGGDAQQATGYYLFFCVFTFSCSTAYLSRVALPYHRLMRCIFVVVTTVSGPTINLIWANNFDNLLALSLAPAILGLAMDLHWGSKREAAALAVLCGAEFCVYPELAAFFVLPAALTLAVRLFKERPKGSVITISIGSAALLAVLAPAWSDIYQIMTGQYAATLSGARPGSGYYPTLLSWSCTPGAMIGLYAPFSQCANASLNALRFVIGTSVLLFELYALIQWKRSIALGINAALITLGFGYFLFAQRYDYGAFKLVIAGMTPVVLLVFIVVIDASRRTKIAGSLVAAGVVILAMAQIVLSEALPIHKSMDAFSGLTSAVPVGSIVDVRIDDPLRFQWATYYLRFHRIAISAGQLPYYKNPDPTVEPSKSRLQSPGFIVTDHSISETNRPIWTNAAYRVYKADTSTVAVSIP